MIYSYITLKAGKRARRPQSVLYSTQYLMLKQSRQLRKGIKKKKKKHWRCGKGRKTRDKSIKGLVWSKYVYPCMDRHNETTLSS